MTSEEETKIIKFTELTLNKIETILESISDGCSVTDSCDKAGLSRMWFYQWRNSSQDNRDRYYIELDKCSQAVENALFKKALMGDTTAMIFWLTNRAKTAWVHKNVQEIRASVNHTQILEELEADD